MAISNKSPIVCELYKVFIYIGHLVDLYEHDGVLYNGLDQPHQEQDGHHPLV